MQPLRLLPHSLTNPNDTDKVFVAHCPLGMRGLTILTVFLATPCLGNITRLRETHCDCELVFNMSYGAKSIFCPLLLYVAGGREISLAVFSPGLASVTT